jgi:predicted ArsR family transcriptional regulator
MSLRKRIAEMPKDVREKYLTEIEGLIHQIRAENDEDMQRSLLLTEDEAEIVKDAIRQDDEKQRALEALAEEFLEAILDENEAPPSKRRRNGGQKKSKKNNKKRRETKKRRR